MRIEEKLFAKRIIVEVQDPFRAAHETLKLLEQYGTVEEKINKTMSDGPRQRLHLEYLITKRVDEFSQTFINFIAIAEAGTTRFVEANVSARLTVEIDDTGLFSSAFKDFYLRDVFPTIRKREEKICKHLLSRLEQEATAHRAI